MSTDTAGEAGREAPATEGTREAAYMVVRDALEGLLTAVRAHHAGFADEEALDTACRHASAALEASGSAYPSGETERLVREIEQLRCGLLGLMMTLDKGDRMPWDSIAPLAEQEIKELRARLATPPRS